MNTIETKQTHSPGPWKLESIPAEAHADQDLNIAPESKFWIVEQRVAGEVLALVECVGNGNVEANARLIAAAPELLESLERLSAAAINHNHMEVRGQARPCEICTEYDRAQAAILSAKGSL